MIAMDIIRREKKDIIWQGLEPENREEELAKLREQVKSRREQLAEKKRHLEEIEQKVTSSRSICL